MPMNKSWIMSLTGSLVNSVNGIASHRTGNGAFCRGRNRASQVVIERNPFYKMRIGTWNVRTMNKPEKLENIKHEMKRLNIDIMGLSEVRWKESGDYTDGDTRVIYSGGERAERGVAIIVKGKIRRTVERYECRCIYKSLYITLKLSIIINFHNFPHFQIMREEFYGFLMIRVES